MGFKTDLERRVKEIFTATWEKRAGRVVPGDDDITLANDGVEVDATVLYADLSGSTALVDTKTKEFSAEIYKAFLYGAAKIVASEGGEITAYDGDRIMAVFIGDSKNTSAARAALKIHWMVGNIINPGITKQYGANTYSVKQVVGIDSSKLLVAKTGVRGANDLVWVGRAANYAAKLCSLNEYATYITDSVFEQMNKSLKSSQQVADVWTRLTWNQMNKTTIYGSSCWWPLQD